MRGWRVVAEKTLKDLQAFAPPDHEKASDLVKIADIVTAFLGDGHKMLNQKTKQYERKKLAGRLLAEMVSLDVKEPRRLESHGTK